MYLMKLYFTIKKALPNRQCTSFHATGCHFTGPVALRPRLSSGLPNILLKLLNSSENIDIVILPYSTVRKQNHAVLMLLKMSTLNSTFFHVFIVLPFCTIRSLFYCIFSLLGSAIVRLPLLPASHAPYFRSYASCFTSSSNSSPAE